MFLVNPPPSSSGMSSSLPASVSVNNGSSPSPLNSNNNNNSNSNSGNNGSNGPDSILENLCQTFYSMGPVEGPVTQSLVATFYPWIGQMRSLPGLASIKSAQDLVASNYVKHRIALPLAIDSASGKGINFSLETGLSTGDVNVALSVFEALMAHSVSSNRLWTLCFVVSMCLTDLIKEPGFKKAVSGIAKIKLMQYLFNMLVSCNDIQNQGTKIFLRRSISKLAAMITFSSWFESEEVRNFHLELLNKASKNEYLTVLALLLEIVEEMKKPVKTTSIASKQRKAVVMFRDFHLLPIFKFGLGILNFVVAQVQVPGQSKSDLQYLHQVHEVNLGLLDSILSFDFLGASVDESNDEMGTVQIPHSWKVLYDDSDMLASFFRSYCIICTPPFSSLTLQAIVYITCSRRSIFSNSKKRFEFVEILLKGTLEIMTNTLGLAEESNYHEFCRLLSNFKNAFLIQEILERDNYPAWIEAVKNFTFKSFHSGNNISRNSLQYLLTFWSKLVSSHDSLKSSISPGKVKLVTDLEVVEEFIKSRCNLIPSGSIDSSLEVLDDYEVISSQTDLIVALLIAQNDELSEFMGSFFGPMISQYKQIADGNLLNLSDEKSLVRVYNLEQQICWLIVLATSILTQSSGYTVKGRQDELNSSFAALILSFADTFDTLKSKYTNNSAISSESLSSPIIKSKVKVEICLILYLEQLRKNYIGQSRSTSSVFFGYLSQKFGEVDSTKFLRIILKRLFENLQFWAQDPLVVDRSLSLFNEVCSNYGASKILLKLDFIQYLLERISTDDFAFLYLEHNLKSRTIFYASFSKLLFAVEDDNPFMFDHFLVPFHNTFLQLKETIKASSNAIEELIRNNKKFKVSLIGLLRDLRGVLQSLTVKGRTICFMEWICGNDFLDVFIKVSEAISPRLESYLDVMIPMLKFYSELMFNRGGRLNGEREQSMIFIGPLYSSVKTFVERFCALTCRDPIPPIEPYPKRYKPISVCLNIIKNALGSNCLNVGIFAYFGSDIVPSLALSAFSLVQNIAVEELVVYPKLSMSYYSCMEIVFRSAWNVLPQSIPLSSFEHFCTALGIIISTDDSASISCACSTLDCLISQTIRLVDFNNEGPNFSPLVRPSLFSSTQNSERNHPWIVFFSQRGPFHMGQWVRKIINRIMMEDCTTQWTLSRPLYTLFILLDEVALKEIIYEVCQGENDDTVLLINGAFEALTSNVINTINSLEAKSKPFKSSLLASKYREGFTNAVCNFRRDLNDRRTGSGTFNNRASESGAVGGGNNDPSGSGLGVPSSHQSPISPHPVRLGTGGGGGAASDDNLMQQDAMSMSRDF